VREKKTTQRRRKKREMLTRVDQRAGAIAGKPGNGSLVTKRQDRVGGPVRGAQFGQQWPC